MVVVFGVHGILGIWDTQRVTFPLPRVVLLICEQHLNPVEVEVVFQAFVSTEAPDSYTVTCRTASNHLVRW